VRYSDLLAPTINKHPRPFQSSVRIAPKTPAARKRSAQTARRFELKMGANGMLAYVATTLPGRFDSGLTSPGKPPKAQKIGAQRRVFTATRRPVPTLSEESKDLHRKIADAGDQLSLSNVSQSLLARYGAK
jgi:hypothetical protein